MKTKRFFILMARTPIGLAAVVLFFVLEILFAVIVFPVGIFYILTVASCLYPGIVFGFTYKERFKFVITFFYFPFLYGYEVMKQNTIDPSRISLQKFIYV